MRIKANRGSVQVDIPLTNAVTAAPISAPATSGLAYRLVPALGFHSSLPAVAAALGSQLQQLTAMHLDPRPPEQPSAVTAKQLEATSTSSHGDREPASTAHGRPVRKRKLARLGDDMIPPDALWKRSSKAKPAPPADRAPLPPLQQHGQLSWTASPPARSAETPALGQAPIKRDAGPDACSSKQTGPAAAPLAMPSLQQTGSVRQWPCSIPYRLIHARPAVAAVSLSAVKEAAAQDVSQLASQHADRAAALADGRVTLQVLPHGSKAVAAKERQQRGATTAAAPPPSKQQAPADSGGQNSGGPADARAPGRGRSRISARGSQRPTPELPDSSGRAHQPAVPNKSWHPGFELRGGVTYINVLQSCVARPPAAVVVSAPPRLKEAAALAASNRQAQFHFSEDPLLASLEYLRHAAQNVGRLQPYTSSAVQAAVQAEQRLYRDRLARAQFARDGRRLGRPPVEPTRKSVRMRSAPEVFIHPDDPDLERSKAAGSRQQQQQQQQQAPLLDPADDTDVQYGRDFQARLPALRPRPAAPTEAEARYVRHLVCQASDEWQQQYDVQQAAALASSNLEERASLVAQAHHRLADALGPERAAAMGLLAMGATAFAGLLSAGEEAELQAGMREFGRAFHTIQREKVPTRTVYDLQNWYYNCWKLCSTERSRAWYREREIEELQRQAEQERQQQEAAAEEEAQKQRQEQRYRRRMLKEVVQWVKTAARTPGAAHHRPTVLQRAMRVAKLIGSLNAHGLQPITK